MSGLQIRQRRAENFLPKTRVSGIPHCVSAIPRLPGRDRFDRLPPDDNPCRGFCFPLWWMVVAPFCHDSSSLLKDRHRTRSDCSDRSDPRQCWLRNTPIELLVAVGCDLPPHTILASRLGERSALHSWSTVGWQYLSNSEYLHLRCSGTTFWKRCCSSLYLHCRFHSPRGPLHCFKRMVSYCAVLLRRLFDYRVQVGSTG